MLKIAKHPLLPLMGIVLLAGSACIDWGHSWHDDFALYLEQSHALIEGRLWPLYEQNKFAMNHSGDTTGPYLYPLGYPLLLLPMVGLFGNHWWLLKGYTFLFFVLALPLLQQLLRKLSLQSATQWSVLLLVGLNYHYIRFADWLYADLPFFFFVMASLWLLYSAKANHLGQQLLLGGCLLMSYLIRDIGIVLLPTLGVYWLASKRWNKPLSYLPFLIFGAGVFLIKIYLPAGGANHLDLLQQVDAASIWKNLQLYFNLGGNIFVLYRGIPPWTQYIISAACWLMIGLGIYAQTKNTANRNEQLSLLVFILSYISVCLLWPSFQGMRFWFPLLPWLMLLFVDGVQLLLGEKAQLALYGLIIFLGIQTVGVVYYYANKNTNEVYTTEQQNIYQYIRKHLPKAAIIVCRKPRTLRLFTKRNGIQKPTPTANYFLVSTNQKQEGKVLLTTKHFKLIKKE